MPGALGQSDEREEEAKKEEDDWKPLPAIFIFLAFVNRKTRFFLFQHQRWINIPLKITPLAGLHHLLPSQNH